MQIENLYKKFIKIFMNLKIKQAQKEGASEGAIGGVVRRIEPYIEPMMNHFFPKNMPKGTQIAAVGFGDTSEEIDQDRSKKLRFLLEKWQDLDQDNFVEVIEKIVNTASSDMASYKMYRQMLIGR